VKRALKMLVTFLLAVQLQDFSRATTLQAVRWAIKIPPQSTRPHFAAHTTQYIIEYKQLSFPFV
jgi:hypothetical protein